jgi:hypothetical protein
MRVATIHVYRNRHVGRHPLDHPHHLVRAPRLSAAVDMRSLKQVIARHWLRSHAALVAGVVIVVGVLVYMATR